MSDRMAFRPNLEQLGERLNPSLTWSTLGGVLYVSGDAQSNAIGIRVFDGTISILDGSTVVHVRPVASVSGVVLGGGFGGDDTFLVQGDDSLGKLKKISLLGGDGDDRFLIASRAVAIPPIDVAGRGGHDTLVVSQAMPHGGRVESIEEGMTGRLAAAQIELRDRRVHPEMGNLYKMLQIPAGSRVLTSSPGSRDPLLTRDVLFQFEVESGESAGRYRKGTNGNGDTRCNLFVGDALRAMNVPLPTKAQFAAGGDGNMWIGAADANRWLNGNRGTGSLQKSAVQMGWVKIDPRTPAGMTRLLDHIASGKPAVASTPDHIAFVRPNQVGGLTPATLGQLNIAQAGGRNFTYGALANGWPASRLNEIQFFIHE